MRVLGFDRIGQGGDDALGALHLGHHEGQAPGAAESGEQLRFVERLGEEVVRARIEPGDDIVDRRAPREQDHGHRDRPRVRPQAAADLETIHPGQTDVQQHDIRRRLERGLEARRSVVRGDRSIAGTLEQRGQQGTVRRVILDHEDGRRRGFDEGCRRGGVQHRVECDPSMVLRAMHHGSRFACECRTKRFSRITAACRASVRR